MVPALDRLQKEYRVNSVFCTLSIFCAGLSLSNFRFPGISHKFPYIFCYFKRSFLATEFYAIPFIILRLRSHKPNRRYYCMYWIHLKLNLHISSNFAEAQIHCYSLNIGEQLPLTDQSRALIIGNWLRFSQVHHFQPSWSTRTHELLLHSTLFFLPFPHLLTIFWQTSFSSDLMTIMKRLGSWKFWLCFCYLPLTDSILFVCLIHVGVAIYRMD
jgi:hypothetical protein